MLAPVGRSVSPPEWRVATAQSVARSEFRKVSLKDVFSESEFRPVPVSAFSLSSTLRLFSILASALSWQPFSFSPTLVLRSGSVILLAWANSSLLPGFRSVSVSAKRSSLLSPEAMLLLSRAERATRLAWARQSVPVFQSLLLLASTKPLSFLLASLLPFSFSALGWAISRVKAMPSHAVSPVPRALLPLFARERNCR